MQYHTPSLQAAEEWISRTYSCSSTTSKQDFQELRQTLLAAKQGHDEDNAFLLSCAGLDEDEHGNKVELVKHAQIMMCVDHQVADGIGVYILLGKYLTLLASELGRRPGGAEMEMRWEESWKNLSPPWILRMNDEQVFSGKEYEEIAERNRDVILNKSKQNPGLPLLSPIHPNLPSTQETHFMTFTTSQTTALLHAIKNIISPTSNITHLGHAAMVLALLRFLPQNSQPTSTRALYSPCWLNGRRYLQDTGLMRDYVPICQSFAPVVFDLKEPVVGKEAGKEEVREKLVKACRMATEEYRGIRERRSMLPGCVILFEELGQKMSIVAEQKETSASQAGIKKINESLQTADPFFLSDGIIEQYISHSYPFPTNSNSGPLITVDDVQFAANAEKNLIVRMSSWRGQTTVSGEWKGNDFEKGMVIGFLEDVVGIMMSIVDDEEMK